MIFFWTVLSLVGFGLTGVLVFGNKGLYQLYKLSQERDRLLRMNQEVRAENDRLLKTIDRLQHDREMIEDMIRSELHYLRPDERIYYLEPELGNWPRTTASPKSSQAIAKSPPAKSGRAKKTKP
ncbi:MAG: septum formation initiator family protein [Deltaproteobacteria bacterium]|nr:septum formation initiator family protein [Deltaproteobacteria bacterium]MBW2134811.1 septum formation initiator family protein [Deltaproteobacteria bacterium]